MLLSPEVARRAGMRGARIRSLAVGVVGASLLIASGCGEPASTRTPVYPVNVKITYKGFPAAGAVVTFHPKTPREDTPAPRAEVNKDGVVKVSTYDGGDGAPEGEYVVTVQWRKLIKQGADLVQGPNVIPAKYARPQTSNIVRVVKAGENELQAIAL